MRSTAEGAVEEGGEEVLSLTRRLTLHRTQALYSLDKGPKLLLERKRRERNLHFLYYSLIDFVGSVRRACGGFDLFPQSW